ncbi:MAG: ribosome biogenesis GTP-binding protein YsxC [Myxococcales bacterium FL481]|nr:MAG: ribosome biogenesis GTP-binding protein YsxC [Myxococcales bacterium FL481]
MYSLRALMPDKASSWRVVDSAFELSAPSIAECPAQGVPEIAVAGRSNVGKSSLLNAICGQRSLARVSRTPGRTRLLNFFAVRLRGPSGDLALRLVDLPGYGFAVAERSVRASFGPMIEGFFAGRGALCGLLLLVDARRDIQEPELQLLEYMSRRQLPTLLCATKVDKLKAGERGLVAAKLAKRVGVAPRDVLLTSARDRIGLGADDRFGGLPDQMARLVSGEVA